MADAPWPTPTLSTAALPIRNTPDLRKRINSHDAHYFDLHLSELAQKFRYGFYGDLDVAILEVAEVMDNGEVVLGTGVGNVPTFVSRAKKVILELNEVLPKTLYGSTNIYLHYILPPREIPIFSQRPHRLPHGKDRPEKIVAVVHSKRYDGIKGLPPSTTPHCRSVPTCAAS